MPKCFLDPGRFYELNKIINLTETHFGVAARLAAVDFQVGLITYRAYADDLLAAQRGNSLEISGQAEFFPGPCFF